VPLFSIDWLPAVTPSFGVFGVARNHLHPAERQVEFLAAICANAVTMPWPSSTLPVQTVALPSVPMQIQASSRRWSRLPGALRAAARQRAAEQT
jgi:hypothetical protein